jgi:hypothetical protein
MNRRFLGGFHDQFENLDKWDFIGPWRIVDKGTLLVTGSDEGGITKVGSHWENYTFYFSARIISKCIGFIVRAQDLNNYYMFQIRPDKIRPHFRMTVPMVLEEQIANVEEGAVRIHLPVNYIIKWLHDGTTSSPEYHASPISQKLETWFDVKAEVFGQSVKIWINNELVFQQPALLRIPTGKVGFRNSISEEAYVKDAKVEIHI